jgi:hypothetical protein
MQLADFDQTIENDRISRQHDELPIDLQASFPQRAELGASPVSR